MKRLALVLLAACTPMEPRGSDDPRADELPTGRTAMPVIAPGACPARVGAGAAPLVRTPYLNGASATGVSISFATAHDGTAEIRYARADGALASVLAERLVLGADVTGLEATEFQYTARIEGLSPTTEYCYVPVVDGVQLATPASFRTAPAPGSSEAFDALVFGDSGNASAAQRRVLAQMAQRDFDLILHTGDLAYEMGSYRDFAEKVFGIYGGLFNVRPFFPSPGNHEYETASALPYRTLFALPEQASVFTDNERYYSFDWGGAHFVSLDTNDPLDGSDMGAWLADDLAQSRARFKIVFFHHPPYSSGPHGSNRTVQQKLVPLFQAGGVDLVLSGHDHDYERTHPMWNNTPASHGITYVVTGGGGGGLYDPAQTGAVFTAVYAKKYHFLTLHIEGCTLQSIAIDEDGAEIDRVTLSKCEVGPG